MKNKITDGYYLEYLYKKILQKVNKKNIFLTLSLQNWILSNEDKRYNYFHIIKIIKSFFKKKKKLKISKKEDFKIVFFCSSMNKLNSSSSVLPIYDYFKKKYNCLLIDGNLNLYFYQSKKKY